MFQDVRWEGGASTRNEKRERAYWLEAIIGVQSAAVVQGLNKKGTTLPEELMEENTQGGRREGNHVTRFGR